MSQQAEAQAFVEGVVGRPLGGTFGESLKSGVVLCEFLEKVKPGSLPAGHKVCFNGVFCGVVVSGLIELT
jgi:hypothetical protein